MQVQLVCLHNADAASDVWCWCWGYRKSLRHHVIAGPAMRADSPTICATARQQHAGLQCDWVQPATV